MSFAPAVATNLRNACYPAVVGLYRLGQDYAFMTKVQFSMVEASLNWHRLVPD